MEAATLCDVLCVRADGRRPPGGLRAAAVAQIHVAHLLFRPDCGRAQEIRIEQIDTRTRFFQLTVGTAGCLNCAHEYARPEWGWKTWRAGWDGCERQTLRLEW